MTLVTPIPLAAVASSWLRSQANSAHLPCFVFHPGIEPVGRYQGATIAVPIGYKACPRYHMKGLVIRAFFFYRGCQKLAISGP